jgi:tetratricopeptide (TPR) repeat protein
MSIETKMKALTATVLVFINIVLFAANASVLLFFHNSSLKKQYQIDGDPQEFGVYIKKGWGYLNIKPTSISNIKKAMRNYREAIEADPRNLNGYLLLARTYLNAGSPQDAVTILQGALILFPEDPTVKRILSRCYEKMNDKALANHPGNKSSENFQPVKGTTTK